MQENVAVDEFSVLTVQSGSASEETCWFSALDPVSPSAARSLVSCLEADRLAMDSHHSAALPSEPLKSGSWNSGDSSWCDSMAPNWAEPPFLAAEGDLRISDLPSLSDLLSDPSTECTLEHSAALGLSPSPGSSGQTGCPLWSSLPDEWASTEERGGATHERQPSSTEAAPPLAAAAVTAASGTGAAERSGGGGTQRQQTVAPIKHYNSAAVELGGKQCAAADSATRTGTAGRPLKRVCTELRVQQSAHQHAQGAIPGVPPQPSPCFQTAPSIALSLMPPLAGFPYASSCPLDTCLPPALAHTAAGKKVGRPRVYDTVTPVLVAAESAAARPPSGSGKRCRGAKPKYLCHTEQEAVAKRCALTPTMTLHLHPPRITVCI